MPLQISQDVHDICFYSEAVFATGVPGLSGQINHKPETGTSA